MSPGRLKKSFAMTATVWLAGCVTMAPPDLPASHPANPEAPQAQLILRTEIERYSPPTTSAAGAGDREAMSGMHGMDHSAHGQSAVSPGDMPQMDHGHTGRGSDSTGKHASESPAGRPAMADHATRTVKVSALDTMRFEPKMLTVKAGETIRFVVTNAGKLPHEFVIGGRREQQEHEEMMKQMPGMRHEHGNALTLAPSETRTLVWQFDKPGTYELACHIPGHYEAGMVSTVMVTPGAAPDQQPH